MDFWRKDFSEDQIDFILSKIKKIRMIGEDGRISFSGGDYDQWIAVLISLIELKVKSNAIRHRIVKGTLSHPELPADFTKKNFCDIAYRLRNKYERQDLKVYRVAFPIWNLPKFLQVTKKINNVNLNFAPSNNTRVFKTIIRERQVQQTRRDYEFFFTKDRLTDLNSCSICVAHVRANSPADANERASEALYEILGLVNLAADSRKHWRFSSRLRGTLPVSDVLIGPHTTTHFENGKLAYEGFWYENWIGGPNPKAINAEGMEAWEKRSQQLFDGVAKSLWRDHCKSASARYFKAFSNPNLEESFLEGWRLFENISGSRYHKISDQVLRASNIFEDNIEYMVVGKHLQLRRNLLAHGHAIKANDEEALAFQMLQFLTPFLERYILNGFKFPSREVFWEFLDLPSQRQERNAKKSEHKRQLDLLAKASKFRGETDW